MSDTITVRLPGELKYRLKSTCKRTNLKASQLVREAIQRYLAVQRFRELRAETIPYAERAGFYTDEDVLQKESR